VTVAFALAGDGYDSNVSGVTLIPMVAPPSVIRDEHECIVILTWSASVAAEVPPSVAMIGTGWSQLVAPRTIQTLGWAAYTKSGVGPGDALIFQLSSARIVTAQDLYFVRAATPFVAGTPNDRVASVTTCTAPGMATTEAGQFMLAVEVERSTGFTAAVTNNGGTTPLVFRKGIATGRPSIYVGSFTGPTPSAPTSDVTVTYNIASANGGGAQIALPSPAAPAASLLHPNDELVAAAWLRDAVSYLGGRVATSLPTDNSTWSASGFTVVSAIGGTPDIYVPRREPIISIDCYGVAARSGKPPWNLASQQAEQIRLAMLDHATVPRKLTMPTGYRSAYLQQAIPRSEPRRINDDVASYAHYQLDAEFWWTEGP
jgi:hypothetical protein